MLTTFLFDVCSYVQKKQHQTIPATQTQETIIKSVRQEVISCEQNKANREFPILTEVNDEKVITNFISACLISDALVQWLPCPYTD